MSTVVQAETSSSIKSKNTKFYKWLKDNYVLPLVFSVICLSLEIVALVFEKTASLSRNIKSQVILLNAAISVSSVTLGLILLSAFVKFKRSGAKACDWERHKIPCWGYYKDGDSYNCVQDFLSIAFGCIQLGFLLHARLSLRKENSKTTLQCSCHDAMLYPLIFNTAEVVLLILSCLHITSVPKMYCAKSGEYLQLHRKLRRGNNTFECFGCMLARLNGTDICIMPVTEFLVLNEEWGRIPLLGQQSQDEGPTPAPAPAPSLQAPTPSHMVAPPTTYAGSPYRRRPGFTSGGEYTTEVDITYLEVTTQCE